MASFSGLKTIGKDLLDYMMSHRPLPDEELSMGLHDLNEVFPGIYGNAVRNYKTGAGDKIDREALDAIMTAKGNPDAMIDIYRAVPKGVKDFNVGDWVTTSKSYAKNHGEGPLKGDYDLITTKARASDIAEPGDSIAEQGYWGPKVTGSLTKGYLPFGIGLGTLASAGMIPDDVQAATASNQKKSDWLRQLGLGTRGLLEGATAIPQDIANLINGAFGGDPEYFGNAGTNISDMIGLPKAETDNEKLASAINKGLTEGVLGGGATKLAMLANGGLGAGLEALGTEGGQSWLKNILSTIFGK